MGGTYWKELGCDSIQHHNKHCIHCTKFPLRRLWPHMCLSHTLDQKFSAIFVSGLLYVLKNDWGLQKTLVCVNYICLYLLYKKLRAEKMFIWFYGALKRSKELSRVPNPYENYSISFMRVYFLIGNMNNHFFLLSPEDTELFLWEMYFIINVNCTLYMTTLEAVGIDRDCQMMYDCFQASVLPYHWGRGDNDKHQ